MSKKSVYRPSRKGAKEIPLSFTGRHLLQSMREAVIDMADKAVEKAQAGQVFGYDWTELSRVRERIAQYMSDLEKKTGEFLLSEVPEYDLVDELDRRGYTVQRKLPPWHRRDPSESIGELLDAGFTVSVTHDYRRPPDKNFTVRVDGVVNAEQAQHIGQRMTENLRREQERANQKINIIVNPLNDLIGKTMIVELETTDHDALLSEYIVKPRANCPYLPEITFKARNVEAARTRVIKEYGAYGFLATKEDFDLFVKTHD